MIMKIRTGFVSNSSSSSFVIGLKARPKTWQDMHVILFGDMVSRELRPDWMKPEYESYATFFETSFAVAQNVFNQIEDQDVVPNSVLKRCCDPGKYLDYRFGEDRKAVTAIQKRMKARYAVEYPYCISPTNRRWKELCKLQAKGRVVYNAEINRRREAKWAKIIPKFKGLKKFVIMTQSDAGKDGKILAIMESTWGEISKKVKWVQLTTH